MHHALTYARSDRSTVEHIVPVDDLIAHDGDSFGACPCGPQVEAIGTMAQLVGPHGATGPIRPHVFGWVVIHSSLDGREHAEV